MDEVRKIAFVIPSLQAGGMERVMSELLWFFSKNEKVEMHLILYGIKRDIFYPIPKNINIHKPRFKFNNKFRLWSTIKTLTYLRRILRGIQPHSSLSFGEYWNSFVLLASLGLKLRIFVSDRCQPNKSLGQLHDFLRNRLYPTATGVIAQTEMAKNIFLQMYHHPNIQVIGNPIRSIQPEKTTARENIVLSVGRLIDSKHHEELIKLFVSINNLDWKLIIVGDDALKQQNKERLQKLIEALGAENNVELTGRRLDVEQFYLRSKIFAFTSSSEGFPNAIGEAMSAGLPVVAFDCIAGPSEMVHDGNNGYLVPLFDYRKFRELLESLMQDEKKRKCMGNIARDSIQKFSNTKICQKFEWILLSSS